ncbi:MAG: hypothetical protein ACRCZK_00580 [Oscillospiraceae bacterium]
MKNLNLIVSEMETIINRVIEEDGGEWKYVEVPDFGTEVSMWDSFYSDVVSVYGGKLNSDTDEYEHQEEIEKIFNKYLDSLCEERKERIHQKWMENNE